MARSQLLRPISRCCEQVLKVLLVTESVLTACLFKLNEATHISVRFEFPFAVTEFCKMA